MHNTRVSGGIGERLVVSEVLGRTGAPHAFTTRGLSARAGVSRGVFESLNFGNPSDLSREERDPAENIRENWRRVMRSMGCEERRLVQVHQVHGAGVLVLRRGERHDERLLDSGVKADAIVTDDAGLLAAVRVADCAPLLLASGDGRVVAAVHAGWRGVVADVVGAAVLDMERLGVERGRIVAAVGPCIGAGAFEVGMEVVREFERVFGEEEMAKGQIANGQMANSALPSVRRVGEVCGDTPSGLEDSATSPAGVRGRMYPDAIDGSHIKEYVDLKAALRVQLVRAGVAEGRIEVVAGCTASEPERFFSHRREKGKTGRMAGVVGVRK